MMEQIRFPWSKTPEQLYELIGSRSSGLTDEEVIRRQSAYGSNQILNEHRYDVVSALVKKILNPLILILLFSSVLSALLGELHELVIILGILVISITIDIWQERGASNAVERLRSHVEPQSSVIRDGKALLVPTRDLVVGDIIELRAGMIIPADARLITSDSLNVSEATLTGESFPRQKQATVTLVPETILSKQDTMVFAGTIVLSGTGRALVIAIGKQTQIGKVAEELERPRAETAFEKGIREFGQLISRYTMVLVLIVFAINLLNHHPLIDAFLFSLAIAIGLTPELLPVIVSINLAKGAARMAKKSVIVKSLPSIQILGSMDVLCTDKTGTLTQDHIRLEQYMNVDGDEDPIVLDSAIVHSHAQTGINNPIEHAILTHAHEHLAHFKKVAEVPFDFERRAGSVIVNDGTGTLLIIKGAPDRILRESSSMLHNGKSVAIDKTKIRSQIKTLEQQGFRVLAIAQRDIEAKKSYTTRDETDLTFTGLLAFFDPPKEFAMEALEKLTKQGVAIKIITGDSEIVTQKICNDLQLPLHGITTGDAFEQLNASRQREVAQTTTIFARCNPSQKQLIITRLKEGKAVVGYIGDGINDAQSLREADVGISVNNAVDVAKDSADIILLHKSLRVLHDGVVEGRTTYHNILKYILMGMSANVGNMISMAIASVFLPFLPMLPIQILLNDLLYDVSELVIPSDNVDPEATKSPQRWDMAKIQRFLLVFGPISSLFDLITFVVLRSLHVSPTLFQTIWFLESLCSQLVIIFAIRTRRVPFWKSKPSALLVSSTLSIMGLALLIPLTTLRTLFFFARPNGSYYLLVLGITVGYVVTVELVKKWFYRTKNKLAIQL